MGGHGYRSGYRTPWVLTWVLALVSRLFQHVDFEPKKCALWLIAISLKNDCDLIVGGIRVIVVVMVTGLISLPILQLCVCQEDHIRCPEGQSPGWQGPLAWIQLSPIQSGESGTAHEFTGDQWLRHDTGMGKPVIMCHEYAQVQVWVWVCWTRATPYLFSIVSQVCTGKIPVRWVII